MGEDPDFDINDLIDDKWYCVTVDAFWDGTAARDCTQNFWLTASACRLGLDIKNWLNDDEECRDAILLVPTGGQPAQKLINIGSPHDTRDECIGECP